ncbi:MATE family efflux transporter [Dethiothermospora halolimnae]|uniref:MATE family efflux transporter n=1 Tax=Dethiothermospora halolimnae TaxID=3114390 RepID=UPI003CCBFDC2
MKDLTKGHEGKLIFYFALPMLIGNIFQQLYNTVDSIIVGNFLGKEALAAVSTSFPVLFLLISLIMGITMGSTILISQFYGAKDYANLKKTIDTTYIFLFVGSILITILGLVLSGPILKLLNTPGNILPQAKSYINVIFIGIVAMFGYNSISAILRGLGDSKTPLKFLIISTILNIILDVLFIVVFKFGVSGAAWATVIAQGFSFIYGIYHLNKHHEVLKFNVKDMEFDKAIFFKSLKIGLPSGVQQVLFSLGMMAIQSIINPFGETTMAAFGAGSRLNSFGTMPIMNFGSAISAFVGQNLGAGKNERVKKGYKYTLLMSVSMSIIITVLVFIFGEKMVWLFNKDPEVIKIGTSYLKIVSSFYAVVSIMFITTGVLRGAGDTFVPMIISILTLWLIRIPVATFLSERIGTNGIWASVPAGWTIGMVLTIGYYMSGRWKKKVVIKRGLNYEQ